MHDAFEYLASVLDRLCARGPVYYYPNPGNWGDALIDAGTRRLFADIGLVVQEVNGKLKHRARALVDRGTLIYGGGGAWCRYWGEQTDFLSRDWRLYRHVIVMPSTYERAAPLPNGTFFARDEHESLERVPEAHFCHDLAFYLDPGDWPPGKGVGSFFRRDAESAGALSIPADNCDLSAEGRTRSPIEPFFERIARHEIIRTDRLHVAIAACLLGREVHLHAGGYFKNQAVFRSSIEPYFPRARFHADGSGVGPFGDDR